MSQTQHKVDEAQQEADLREIEDAVQALMRILKGKSDTREFALARTKLDEAFMWAREGIYK